MYQGTYVVFRYPPCECYRQDPNCYNVWAANMGNVRNLKVKCRICKTDVTVPMGDMKAVFMECPGPVDPETIESLVTASPVDAKLDLLDDD